MKYIIFIDGYGYYAGANKKYFDMFNVSPKKFALEFDNIEEAKKVETMLTRACYRAIVESAE